MHSSERRHLGSPRTHGKQVGRAAIIGWRDLLVPALQEPSIDLRLWPFDGDLVDLIAPGAVVVVETYPAEACVHLGLTPPGRDWSKTAEDPFDAMLGLLSMIEVVLGFRSEGAPLDKSVRNVEGWILGQSV